MKFVQWQIDIDSMLIKLAIGVNEMPNDDNENKIYQKMYIIYECEMQQQIVQRFNIIA